MLEYFSAFDRLLIASHLSWIDFVGDSKLPMSNVIQGSGGSVTQNCIVLVNSVCSVCWLEGPTQSPLEYSLGTDDSVKLFSVSDLILHQKMRQQQVC